MQSNKSPDLLVRNSETGRWIKVSVQITQNDNDDCDFESQFKSSESCHQNGIESCSHTQIGHCDHVDEEAIPDICHGYHGSYPWRKNLSCGEISNSCTWQVWGNLKFLHMWIKFTFLHITDVEKSEISLIMCTIYGILLNFTLFFAFFVIYAVLS